MRLSRVSISISSWFATVCLCASAGLANSSGDVGHATSAAEFQNYSIRHSIRKAAANAAPGVYSSDKQGHESDKPNPKFSCELTVSPSGSIVDLKIGVSSGSPAIDENALELIKSAKPFKAFTSLTKDNSYLIEFPNLDVNPVLEESHPSSVVLGHFFVPAGFASEIQKSNEPIFGLLFTPDPYLQPNSRQLESPYPVGDFDPCF